MRVLHVITGLDVGGAETMLARLMELRNRHPSITPSIISLTSPGAIASRIAKTGTPILSLDMASIVPSPGATSQLIAAARAASPDLIMGWMHHGQLAASFAAQFVKSRPPVLWNVRHSLSGYAREKWTSRIVLSAAAQLSRHPAGIIYNSHAAQRQYRAFGYYPDRDLVIPNGFACSSPPERDAARACLEGRFGIAPDAVVIGMIARNHPMKDVTNLITAFAIVHAQQPKAHLLLVGAGMDQPSPAAAILLRHLPVDSWTVAGHDVEVRGWLGGIDLCALPSAWGEGFPNILGEAMSVAVPCVATDVGDSRWIVDETGRIVPPENPDEFARALIELCNLGRDGRALLGARASERIQRMFKIEAVADRYAALFFQHASAPSAGAYAGGEAKAA